METYPHVRRDAAKWLGLPPRGRPVLRLVEDYAGMRRHAGPAVPEWAIAVARRDGLLVFRLDKVNRSPATRLRLVLAHEVVHEQLAHLGGTRLPRWFEEGLCVSYAGLPYLEAPDFSVERRAAAGTLPRFADLDLAFLGDDGTRAAGAYRIGQLAVRFFLERHGLPALHALLGDVANGAPFERAFRQATGTPLEAFEAAWREDVTPALPFVWFVLLENLELTLLCAGALLVAVGYLLWRLRREQAMRRLGGGTLPPDGGSPS